MMKISKALRRLHIREGVALILVAALLLESIALIQWYFSRKGLLEEATRRAESELAMNRLEIEKITGNVEAAARNTSWLLEYGLDRPDLVWNILRQLMENNPDVKDVGVAYVADYFPSQGRWYEPLLARRADGTVEEMVLGSESHDYLTKDWFTIPMETGQGVWSEPYFDESGGKEMVVSYTKPLYDRSGRPVAVLGLDLSLDWLTKLVERINIYPNAYSTMTSRGGELLASPAETLAIGKTLRYETLLDRTGWKLAVVIPEEDIYDGIRKVGLIVTILQLLGLMLLGLIVARSAREQAKLESVEAGKERIENELMIASRIQRSMLPKVFPPFPERSDVDLYAALLPAKEVGGDFYDFFIRDERLFFCIGDVSGKGVPAALVMAMTRSLFRTVSNHEKSPARIVTIMNESMTDMNESNMFVTFFCGVLNLTSGHLRYCNAGHNAPVLLTNVIEPLPVEPNLPLGILAGMAFKEQERDLSYDDALFLYTDGITEAENANKEFFGEHRMQEALRKRGSAREHLENVREAVDLFVGGQQANDDRTMLFLHYMNKILPDASERHLVLHNDIQQIPQLADFVGIIAEEMGLEQSLAMGLNLALEEAVTNVILYAYPPGSDGLVDIEAIMRAKSLEFIISDSGIPFDPTQAPMADVTLNVAERPIGGLGIYLVRSIMDSVKYERKDGQNFLSMTKNI